jgi:hypothetical protein
MATNSDSKIEHQEAASPGFADEQTRTQAQAQAQTRRIAHCEIAIML